MSNDSTSAESTYDGPDYGLGDDNALAHEYSQRNWEDEPRTHNTSRMGWQGHPKPLTVDALSPEMAAPIKQQLAGLTPEQRATHEPKLVMEAVRAASRDARILTGLGVTATPLAKAQVNLAYRERELERRIGDLDSQINEQSGTRMVFDPATGNPVIDPATGQQKVEHLYTLSGGARDAAAAMRQELARQLSVLKGPEGDRELQAALVETVKLHKEREQMRADLAEVDRRARETVREEDINRRAAARAKHLRTALG